MRRKGRAVGPVKHILKDAPLSRGRPVLTVRRNVACIRPKIPFSADEKLKCEAIQRYSGLATAA